MTSRRSLDSIIPSASMNDLPGLVPLRLTVPVESDRADFSPTSTSLELVKVPMSTFLLPAMASLELAGTRVIGFAKEATMLNIIMGRRINRIDGWIKCRSTIGGIDVLEFP